MLLAPNVAAAGARGEKCSALVGCLFAVQVTDALRFSLMDAGCSCHKVLALEHVGTDTSYCYSMRAAVGCPAGGCSEAAVVTCWILPLYHILCHSAF